MISVSTGSSSSTPSISIVDVPAPMTCAPMRFRNAVRSVISGSRAAFSMTVEPFASTAAVNRFSVAPTLGKSRTMRAPHRRLQRASMKPCTTDSSAPIASKPRKCMSSLRFPMLSPPGIATFALPQRASSGPSTFTDARMRVTSSYGASPSSGPDASTVSSPSPVVSTFAPSARITATITSRSATGGMLRSTVMPGASNDAASCLQPEFFVAPDTRTTPESGLPGCTTSASPRAPGAPMPVSSARSVPTAGMVRGAIYRAA